MEIKEQVKKAERIMNYSSFRNFDHLYNFTTENISSYINDFSMKDKSLLTVGSSGDQVLNAITVGCNDITLIDINPFSEEHLNLKWAAIKELEREELISYLISSKKDGQRNFFSKKVYSCLRSRLKSISEDSLYFWDDLYDKYLDFFIGFTMFHRIVSYEEILEFNLYLKNDDLYNELRYNLDYVDFKFINKNIYSINECKIKKKFNNIFLSNIYDYNNKLLRLQMFKRAVKNYINMLSDDGTILITYLHDINEKNKLERFKRKNVLDDYSIKNIVNKNGREDSAIIYQKVKK